MYEEDFIMSDEMIIQKQRIIDRNQELKYQMHKREQVIEDTYQIDEEITINQDVYNLTIAANMTKNCSPVQLIQCLRYCIMVFFIQSFMAYYFCKDFSSLNNF